MKCAFSKFNIDEEIFAKKITFKCQSCIKPLVIYNAHAINKGHGELSVKSPYHEKEILLVDYIKIIGADGNLGVECVYCKEKTVNLLFICHDDDWYHAFFTENTTTWYKNNP